jgi:hypothetical protein
VFRHARHGQRVQRLQQQRADTTDQHGGEIRVHHPGHPVGPEVGLGRVHRHLHGRAPESDRPAQVRREIHPRRCSEPVKEAQGNGGHRTTQGGRAHNRVLGTHG